MPIFGRVYSLLIAEFEDFRLEESQGCRLKQKMQKWKIF